MDLKEKLISSFMAFENHVDIDLPVHDVRSEAIKTFETQGFPSKRDEDWKYTSLNSVLKHDYSVFPKQENAIEYNDVKKYFIHDIDTYKIVFHRWKIFVSFITDNARWNGYLLNVVGFIKTKIQNPY